MQHGRMPRAPPRPTPSQHANTSQTCSVNAHIGGPICAASQPITNVGEDFDWRRKALRTPLLQYRNGAFATTSGGQKRGAASLPRLAKSGREGVSHPEPRGVLAVTPLRAPTQALGTEGSRPSERLGRQARSRTGLNSSGRPLAQPRKVAQNPSLQTASTRRCCHLYENGSRRGRAHPTNKSPAGLRNQRGKSLIEAECVRKLLVPSTSGTVKRNAMRPVGAT